MPRRIERDLATARRRLQRLRSRLGRKQLADDERLRGVLDGLAQSLDALSGEVEALASTGHAQSVALLAASQHARRYEDLFRLAPDAYLVTDDLGVIRDLNAAAEKQFGRSRSYLIGKPLVTLVTPADGGRVLDLVTGLRDRGVLVRDQPVRFGTDPGWDAAVNAIVCAGPEDREIRWLLRDVTESRRAERALRTSEARSRAAVEAAFDGMLGIDAEGVIVTTNNALRRMFGYRPGELEGRAVDVIGLSREKLAANSRELVESIGVRRDGTTFPIQVSARGSREAGETPIVSSVRDLSIQKSLESQLRAATAATAMAEERERQRLASDLHDDVGQMLSLAAMKIGMLRTATGDAAARLRDEVAELVMRTHQRTESLMFQLSPPILRDMGLVSAVEWLGEDIGKSYGLRVHVEHDGEPPLDEATRITTFRSLRELVINAARHARTHSIAVKLARAGDQLDVVVEDRGVGFEFGARTPGFGLASARERVEALGGHFEIESQIGGGTRARFVLALAPAPTGEGPRRKARR